MRSCSCGQSTSACGGGSIASCMPRSKRGASNQRARNRCHVASAEARLERSPADAASMAMRYRSPKALASMSTIDSPRKVARIAGAPRRTYLSIVAGRRLCCRSVPDSIKSMTQARIIAEMTSASAVRVARCMHRSSMRVRSICAAMRRSMRVAVTNESTSQLLPLRALSPRLASIAQPSASVPRESMSSSSVASTSPDSPRASEARDSAHIGLIPSACADSAGGSASKSQAWAQPSRVPSGSRAPG